MFGLAQRGVAMAVADCIDDLFISVGVFIHWMAEDDAALEKNNYNATKASIQNTVAGSPTAAEVVAQKTTAQHPFAANKV